MKEPTIITIHIRMGSVEKDSVPSVIKSVISMTIKWHWQVNDRRRGGEVGHLKADADYTLLSHARCAC